ncbi:pentatricopeptide repeat-containing protein, partial [Tanacetum coccineum]
ACSKLFALGLREWVHDGYVKNHALNICVDDKQLTFFKEMQRMGVLPDDDQTFIALILGCSLTGLLDEGRLIFERMQIEFGLVPTHMIELKAQEAGDCVLLLNIYSSAGNWEKVIEREENDERERYSNDSELRAQSK